MGVSYQTGTLVRTGEERATLVRRTYSLVLVSVLVTMVGASFGLSQPQLMQAVAQHPFIAFFCSLAPLLLATRKKAEFPMNIGLVLLFNLVMGVMISPTLYFYGRTQPGVIGQAAVLTIGAFGILTLYAFVSRRDFSAWGSFLMVGLWVLIGTMLLNFFSGTPRSISGWRQWRSCCSADCWCSTPGACATSTGPTSTSARRCRSTSICSTCSWRYFGFWGTGGTNCELQLNGRET